jgi:hypothetical protein
MIRNYDNYLIADVTPLPKVASILCHEGSPDQPPKESGARFICGSFKKSVYNFHIYDIIRFMKTSFESLTLVRSAQSR